MSTPCNFRFRPPDFALLLLAAGAVLQASLLGWPTLDLLQLGLGALVGAVGFALMLWDWLTFRREHTPVCHRETPVTLVTSGPFRFTRNPMYLGILAMLFGAALAAGDWPMLLPPVGFFAVVYLVFIPCEERWMVLLFGDANARYRSEVRRWI